MRPDAAVGEVTAMFVRRAMAVPGGGTDELGGQPARRLGSRTRRYTAMCRLGNRHLRRCGVHALPVAEMALAQCVDLRKVPPAPDLNPRLALGGPADWRDVCAVAVEKVDVAKSLSDQTGGDIPDQRLEKIG